MEIKKPLQLSHSAVEKLLECSEKYNLHYNKKIRETTASSNLVWGTSIDLGIMELLKTKLEVDPEILPTPYKTFMDSWRTVEINDVKHDAKFCTLIEYGSKDLDLDLFTEYDFDEIRRFYPDQDPRQFATEIQEARKVLPWWSYAELPEPTKKAYNFLCWLTLSRKAQLIYHAFEKQVMPRIKRVLAIQKKVDLIDAEGNTIVGYIDFIAELDDGKIYVLDFKTAAALTRYSEIPKEGKISVKTSQQLSIYGWHEDIKHGGYVVVQKEMKEDGRKKDGIIKVKIKLFLDEFDPEFQEQNLNKFAKVNNQIKSGDFCKKVETPKEAEDQQNGCYSYGRRCPYFNYCWNNKDMTGLIKRRKNDRQYR